MVAITLQSSKEGEEKEEEEEEGSSNEIRKKSEKSGTLPILVSYSKRTDFYV